MLTVYGIKQCDTVRKALKWLDQQGVEHTFHDFRVDGLSSELLQAWLDSEFSDKLVNRRSTTWRKLSEQQRQSEGDTLVNLLLEFPTLIKRPVIVINDTPRIKINTLNKRLSAHVNGISLSFGSGASMK